MHRTINTCAALYVLALTSPASAQETAAADFGFPQNIQQALEITGYYTGETNQFKQTGARQFVFDGSGKLSEVKEMITETIGSQRTYQYDDAGNLVKMTHLFASESGPMASATTYTYETDGNKTTCTRKDPNGDQQQTVAFRNDMGELRGETFFDKHGNKSSYIEYGGKEGYRVKTYQDNKVVTDTVFFLNEAGNIGKTIVYTEPGLKNSTEELTTFEYNAQGDVTKKRVHYPVKSGETPKVMTTYTTEYLYDGDVWVASVTHSDWTYKPEKTLNVTLRRVKTPEKMHTATNEQHVLDFFKQVYVDYAQQPNK